MIYKIVSMEEDKVLPNHCWGRTAYPIKHLEDIPRGDAIVKDHQVGKGSNLSVLIGFVDGTCRVIEKPTLSEGYTVLLFTFLSPGLNTACIKLIATSRVTEERLKSYPSKVKIVSDGRLQIDGSNTTMVKKLVLFKHAQPYDAKQNNSNILITQGEECHIKCIAVDQTANSNIVIFVTETKLKPCYLADEYNQCDCRYVLAELSKILHRKPCRELSQKLQYDSTTSPVSKKKCDALHVCMFCGKGLVRAKLCGRICDDTLTKPIVVTRPVSRTPLNLQPKFKKKRPKTCGCCSKKRKGRDQSEAYIRTHADDSSCVDDETQICRENVSRPYYTDCIKCRPHCRPYSKCTPNTEIKPFFGCKRDPEYIPFFECKPGCTESKLFCRPNAECNCEEILTQECFAAKKGCVVSTECCSSDTQTDPPNESVDFYLICQAYQVKSDKHAKHKCNRKRSVECTHKQSKKHRRQPQSSRHVQSPKRETCPSYPTRFDASEKSSEGSTKSTNKQLSTEEESKEISIQSTESCVFAKRHNAPNKTDDNLFIGRMEGSNFRTYPFQNWNYFNQQYGMAESRDTSRKLSSVTSTSSNGSYLSIGRRRLKRSVFSKKLGFFKSFSNPTTKDSKMGALNSQQ